MSYELRSVKALAGEPCQYGTSRLYVRGPKRDLRAPYLTFIGSTEVFGKFVERPFVQGAEALLGKACVNLGSINAGVDSFLYDESLMAIAAQAELTVVQLMDAQNLSNRFYKVHPRRNDRFLAAHEELIALFPEVDFTDFHFNKHLLTALRNVSEVRYEEVRAHLQESWLERMATLLSKVPGKTALLWLRQEGQGDAELGNSPALIERDMVSALAPRARKLLEFAVKDAQTAEDMPGMLFGPMDLPLARRMIGPKENDRVAALVAEGLRPLLT